MGPAFAEVFTDAGAIVCVRDRKGADGEQHAAHARKNGDSKRHGSARSVDGLIDLACRETNRWSANHSPTSVRG
jgi:hypothetical protein